MPSKGAVLVFDIVDVVPEPEVPESGFKLQLLSREGTKGAVTALDVYPGSLVGIVMGTRFEYLEIFFACARLGAALILFNYAYTDSEMLALMKSISESLVPMLDHHGVARAC